MSRKEIESCSFPIDPSKFDQDERISFSKRDNKHIAVLDDGTEFEFDTEIKRWIPAAQDPEDALFEQYHRNYSSREKDDRGMPPPNRAQGKKRKMDQITANEQQPGNSRNGQKQTPPPKQNTAVYVTGLPPDVTVDEVAELFSRKCGVIAEEIDSGRPRIKLYTDSQGNFKGDALVVFFKPQSVEMAIMLLDDTDFRITPSGLTSSCIRVQAADTSYKKVKYDDKGGDKTRNSKLNMQGQAEGTAAAPKRSDHDKAKIIKKTQKLSAKLADWDDDEPASHFPEPKSSKWAKVVILRHMFTLEELDEDATAMLDIKEDIRDECAKLGRVTNVVLFDAEAEGVVTVKFQTAEAAEACVNMMHGRSFAGKTVEAYFSTGREKFKKSRGTDVGDQCDDDS